MPKLVVTYNDGTIEKEHYDTLGDVFECNAIECRLTWDDVKKVELFDKYGDLRVTAYPDDN